ncbi:uncharacterized protein LOC101894266 [Musca domestica]|uniref:Uncharacterized protein LOC101894266 isoform X2 n=1 Tax=Musca domestica TaxID=7370 RepID=A0A1I8M330_MUSDO|nr:uncharacterized protein LOC101894266 [Musca domestica]
MRTSTVSRYALRLTFGQSSASTPNSFTTTATGNPDRVITRSATCLALFGIALSSFSLKQMLSTGANKSPIMRKF